MARDGATGDDVKEPIFRLDKTEKPVEEFPKLPLDVFLHDVEKPRINGVKREGAIGGMEPIDTLLVPKEWRKEVNESNFGEVAKSLSFFPPDGSGVALSLYDRGYPIASSDAQHFQSLLEKAPHKLNPAEVAKLNTQLLGNVGDLSAFQINAAETKIVNGKNVLAVEGEWKEGGKKFHGLYLPKDGSAREIQEVYFEGREPHFSKHLLSAQNAMSSIKWTGSQTDKSVVERPQKVEPQKVEPKNVEPKKSAPPTTGDNGPRI